MGVKKICFVVTSPFAVNGFLIGHFSELRKHFHITLCVNLKQYELAPKLKDLNLNIIDIPLERKISLCKDFWALWSLYLIFRSNHFESVHSITPKAGLLSGFAALVAGIPHRIHTFTGQVWVTKTGMYSIFLKYIDYLISRFANIVFADSDSQVKFLIKKSVIESNKISVLGSGSISGVDISRFRPNKVARENYRSQLSANEDSCIFLFVGRICRDKGIHDLLSAFNELCPDNPTALLWIVGPDEEGVTEQLCRNYSDIASRVKWLGPSFTPEHYMAAADVLVLPSYREGFGSVIIEAAASGIPAISYRVDGVVDAVLDGITGQLVNPGDVNELSKKMQTMLVDCKMRLALGLAAKKRVILSYSSDNVTLQWVNFYKNLLLDRRGDEAH